MLKKNYFSSKYSLLSFIILSILPSTGFSELPSLQYVVRSKENLFQISQQLKAPHVWQDLARFNQLENPDLLRIGQRLRIPVDWLTTRPASATFTQLAGDVQLADHATTWRAAGADDELRPGHRIKVGPNSSATLKFADGSELTIQPESELRLDTISLYAGGLMSDTRLRLQSGRVEVRANPKGRPHQRLEIITPSAITAVRGTQFTIDSQADETITQTAKGLVKLYNQQGSTMLSGGYVSKAISGQAPLPPSPSPKAPDLERAQALFNDFPIQFAASTSGATTSWITQAGPAEDDRMLTTSVQLKSMAPNFDLGPLPDGNYQLRTWYIDPKGLPSQIALHHFEVQIPRKLVRAPVSIPAHWLAQDLELELPSPADGKRHLVSLTQDVDGRQTLWYAANAAPVITLPKQPQNQTHPYQLWIWVY